MGTFLDIDLVSYLAPAYLSTNKNSAIGSSGSKIPIYYWVLETQNWLEITKSYIEGSNLWYRSGVMCTCNCKVMIVCCSNAALESMQYLFSLLRMVLVLGLWSCTCSPEGNHPLLPHSIGDCLLCACHIMNEMNGKSYKHSNMVNSKFHQFEGDLTDVSNSKYYFKVLCNSKPLIEISGNSNTLN